jgi:hypothetical protein
MIPQPAPRSGGDAIWPTQLRASLITRILILKLASKGAHRHPNRPDYGSDGDNSRPACIHIRLSGGPYQVEPLTSSSVGSVTASHRTRQRSASGSPPSWMAIPRSRPVPRGCARALRMP